MSHWTQSEDQILIDNPKLPIKDLQTILYRTYNSIKYRRIKLGLSNKKDRIKRTFIETKDFFGIYIKGYLIKFDLDKKELAKTLSITIQEHQKPYAYHKNKLISHIIIPGKFIIYKNGDPLDNRVENLIEGTHSEAKCNQKKRSGLTSRYKGVHWNKRAGKWMAAIWFKKERWYLGVYEKEEDAAKAYDDKARELHGKFAKLNIS